FSSRSVFVEKQPGAAERREDGVGLQEGGLPCGVSCPWWGLHRGHRRSEGGGGFDGDGRGARSRRCRPRYVRTNIGTERYNNSRNSCARFGMSPVDYWRSMRRAIDERGSVEKSTRMESTNGAANGSTIERAPPDAA